jgi:esterase/lipase superfamily enzyme
VPDVEDSPCSPRDRRNLVTVVLVAVLMLVGCKQQLVDAPNLYVYGDLDPFAEVPPEFQTNTVDLLYATDRRPEGSVPDDPQYGYERSMSLAFGSCVVELGEDVPWETLKVKRIILAAADISAEVLSQKFIAEELDDGFESITYYASKSDFAIGTAEWLFADKERVGTLRPDQISERERQRLSQQSNIAVVSSKVKHDFIGHGYFLSSQGGGHRVPAVRQGRRRRRLRRGEEHLGDDGLPRQVEGRLRAREDGVARGGAGHAGHGAADGGR